jgi:hypothetical protein
MPAIRIETHAGAEARDLVCSLHAPLHSERLTHLGYEGRGVRVPFELEVLYL